LAGGKFPDKIIIHPRAGMIFYCFTDSYIRAVFGGGFCDFLQRHIAGGKNHGGQKSDPINHQEFFHTGSKRRINHELSNWNRSSTIHGNYFGCRHGRNEIYIKRNILAGRYVDHTIKAYANSSERW
jgi:hypothetical protein